MYPLSAPYKVIAPGVFYGWENSSEMCKDVFRDMEIPWVQDFMLRSRPSQDAYALTDSANYSRAISSVLQYSVFPGISGGFTAAAELVRLVMPVASIDHIGVGLGVDSTTVSGSGDVVFPWRDSFFRCVTNNRDHSFLYVIDEEESGVVTTPYIFYRQDVLWLGALPTFDRNAFF